MKRFSIVLLIKHPTIDPKQISEILGLEPHSSWRAGDPRITPRGTQLAGRHKSSSWNHVRDWEGDYSFASELEKFVLEISKKADFWQRLSEDHARREIFIQFPGDANQGDLIKPDLLHKIAALGLSFGLEIFPQVTSDQRTGTG